MFFFAIDSTARFSSKYFNLSKKVSTVSVWVGGVCGCKCVGGWNVWVGGMCGRVECVGR